MTQGHKILAALVGGGAALWWLTSKKQTAPDASQPGTDLSGRYQEISPDSAGSALAAYGAHPPSGPIDTASRAGSVIQLSPITLDAGGFGTTLGGVGSGGDLPPTSAPLGDGSTSMARGPNGPVFDPSTGLMTPYR